MTRFRFIVLVAISFGAAFLIQKHEYGGATYWALAVIFLSADAICDAIKRGGRA